MSALTDKIIDGGKGLMSGLRDMADYGELDNVADYTPAMQERIAGAVEQGATPRTLYHGGSSNIKEIDPEKFQQRDFGFLGAGLYMSESPAVADFYAKSSARKSAAKGDTEVGANIMPLVTTAKNTKVYTQAEKSEIQNSLKDWDRAKAFSDDLIAQGYDSAAVVDVNGAYTEFVAYDPTIVRSVNAKFDPKKAGSSNIMAGSAATAVGASALMPSEARADDYDQSMYRLDGSEKSMRGFLGPIENVNGGTMTEYSIGVEIDGEEVQMPSMVPTLSDDEIETMRNMRDGDPIPQQIKTKAIDHYYQRIEEGKDPFYQDGEDDVGSIEPYEPNFRDSIQQKLADFMGGERDDVYRSKKIMNVADWLPVTGDATGAADTADSYNEGDYVGAGINAFATLLGVVPVVGKPVAKGVKALGVGVNELLTDGKFLKNYGAEAMDKLDELAKLATAGTTKANALINATVEQGKQVGIRLNLNSKIPDAPKGMDKLQTLHDKNYNGPALSYVPHATVTDVTFNVSQKGRQGIAAKISGMDVPEAKNKFPAMSVDGKLASSENVISKGGDGVIEIGFNPKAHHLFIDMKTGQAVKGAKVATVVGDRVYAKGVKYYKKSEAPEPLNASDGTELPSEVRFNEMNKGGVVRRGQVDEEEMDSGTQEELDTSLRAAAETDDIISTPAERDARREGPSNRLPAAQGDSPIEDNTKPQTVISMSHGGMAMGSMMGLMGPDNITGTDPVSGNPIPIGSSAENVRDDIPAALSAGEFVVPNDVVRWFGLKRYMDMHQEAKMGLMMMREIGQIKGDEEDEYEEDCGCGEEGCPLCESTDDSSYGCGDENCPVCMGAPKEGSEEDTGDDEDYPEAPRAEVIVVEEEYPLDEDSAGVESYPTKVSQKPKG